MNTALSDPGDVFRHGRKNRAHEVHLHRISDRWACRHFIPEPHMAGRRSSGLADWATALSIFPPYVTLATAAVAYTIFDNPGRAGGLCAHA